jgi:hypothetical protein
MRSSFFLILIALSAPPVPGALLPRPSTVVAAAQLRHDLSTPGGDAYQARKLRQLNALIDAFLIHQIEAVPGLSDGQLQTGLTTLVADRDTDYNGSPLVYSNSAIPDHPRVIVVGYEVFLGINGIGGSASIINSYVLADGKAHLAGTGGAEMSGINLHGEVLLGTPDSVTILASGTVYGSNGIPAARAAVYRADTTGVHTVWVSAFRSGLRAVSPNAGEWIIVFVDRNRYQRSPPVKRLNVLELWHFDEQNKPECLLRSHY